MATPNITYIMIANVIGVFPLNTVTWAVENTPDMTGAKSGRPVGTLENITVNDIIVQNTGAYINEPVGPAGGDLTGNYPNPLVGSLQTFPISSAAPAPNDALVWDGSQYSPAQVTITASNQTVNILNFGGAPNTNYLNPANGRYYQDAGYTIESEDDAIKFKNAYTYLNSVGGGSLYVPSGIYYFKTFSAPNNVFVNPINNCTTYGDGYTSQIYIAPGFNTLAVGGWAAAFGQNSFLSFVNNYNVEFHHLYVNCNSQWNPFPNLQTTTVAAGSNLVTLPQGTIYVASTAAFPTSGTLQLTLTPTAYEQIIYTGITSTSFTGCTGGTGTMHTADFIQLTSTQTGFNTTYPQNEAFCLMQGSNFKVHDCWISNHSGIAAITLGNYGDPTTPQIQVYNNVLFNLNDDPNIGDNSKFQISSSSGLVNNNLLSYATNTYPTGCFEGTSLEVHGSNTQITNNNIIRGPLGVLIAGDTSAPFNFVVANNNVNLVCDGIAILESANQAAHDIDIGNNIITLRAGTDLTGNGGIVCEAGEPAVDGGTSSIYNINIHDNLIHYVEGTPFSTATGINLTGTIGNGLGATVIANNVILGRADGISINYGISVNHSYQNTPQYDILIEGNYISNGPAVGVAIYTFAGDTLATFRRLVIRHNIIQDGYGTLSYGLSLYNTYVDTTCRIYDNEIVGASSGNLISILGGQLGFTDMSQYTGALVNSAQTTVLAPITPTSQIPTGLELYGTILHWDATQTNISTWSDAFVNQTTTNTSAVTFNSDVIFDATAGSFEAAYCDVVITGQVSNNDGYQGEVAMFRRGAVMKNANGTITIAQASVIGTDYNDLSANGLSAPTVTIGAETGKLTVTCTGITNTNILWGCTMTFHTFLAPVA